MNIGGNMNNLKYTPSPWKENICGYEDSVEYEVEILNNDGNTICVCINHKIKNDNKEINAKANARLIVAAPEMLEFLIKRAKYQYNMNPEMLDKYNEKTSEMEIIEKATGMKIEEIING